jgi:hypothetical protein
MATMYTNASYRRPKPASPNGTVQRPGYVNKGDNTAPVYGGVNGPRPGSMLRSGTPSVVPQNVPAPAPPPSGLPPFQVTPQGSQGLSNMGIPLPPSYTPRQPMGTANSSVAGGGGGNTPMLGIPGGPTYNDLAGINYRVGQYTGGVINSSVPVEPGAWHGAGIGPNQAAAIGAWQNDQKRLGLEQAFGYRGPQMALSDYGYDAAGNWVLGGTGAAPPSAPMQGGGTGGSLQQSTGASGAVGGGGGASGGNIGAVAGAYDQSQINATNANEQRYRDILSGYGSAFDRQNALLTDAGKVQSDSLNRQFDNLQTRNTQEAVSRGLGGTTILPSMRRGTENSRAQAQNELADQVRQQRLGVDQQNAQATLGFMERRDDVGPDLNQAIALAQALGQSGDGQQVSINGGRPYVAGIDFVGNGLGGGGGYQQPNNNQMLSYLMAMQRAYQQQASGPTYMQRQRQAILNGNQQAAIQKALNAQAPRVPANTASYRNQNLNPFGIGYGSMIA